MKVSQSLFSPSDSKPWQELTAGLTPEDAQLVFAFGLRSVLERPEVFEALRRHYPKAHIALASTSGNLADQLLQDEHVVCSALSLERAHLKCSAVTLTSDHDLRSVCQKLASEMEMASKDLRHVFILSDGGTINGTTLSESLNHYLPEGVTLSGGLAGDGTDFVTTLVGLDGAPYEDDRCGGFLRCVAGYQLWEFRWLVDFRPRAYCDPLEAQRTLRIGRSTGAEAL